MSVMLEKHQGEREIQPASLWPGLVLGGAALRAWQTARDRNQLGMHITSPDGMWLPSQESSIHDLEALQARANKRGNKQLREGLSKIALNDTACWIQDDERTDLLADAARLETTAEPLEDVSVEARGALNMCATDDCQYPRHFDLTYSVPSNRRALLYPNVELFEDQADNGVRTTWGDYLPPIDYSRNNLREFQQQCSPYVAPNETLLTAGGIAQISLLPRTGCWFVRSYFMTPVGVDGYENWQYDGYGRLRLPSHMSGQYDGFPNYAILAHRVTWLLSGRPLEKGKVLNHKCGFRPCANPDHIEQVTTRANNEHGIAMKRSLAIEASSNRMAF